MSSEFPSWRSYWDFARALLSESRYIHTAPVVQFLDAVRDTAPTRTRNLDAGTRLFRAQLGCIVETVVHGDPDEGTEYEVEEEFPFGAERMKPIPGRALEGRANPKGIPYLYLATDLNTAIAEIRPWVGATISVGQFSTTRSTRLIDCTVDVSRKIYLSSTEPPSAEREKAVWGDIDGAFSRPVTPTDDHAAYVPTQVLAELFRNMGYDGIAYRSSVGPGTNIALFSMESPVMVGSGLFLVKGVEFHFAQVG